MCRDDVIWHQLSRKIINEISSRSSQAVLYRFIRKRIISINLEGSMDKEREREGVVVLHITDLPDNLIKLHGEQKIIGRLLTKES